jgi:hypothetical protein
MKLRIYRTFDWVIAVPLSQVSLGGKPPYRLQATDTLQQFDEGSQTWVNIDVEEAAKPPHPNEALLPAMQPGFSEAIAEIMSKVKLSTD